MEYSKFKLSTPKREEILSDEKVAGREYGKARKEILENNEGKAQLLGQKAGSQEWDVIKEVEAKTEE